MRVLAGIALSGLRLVLCTCFALGSAFAQDSQPDSLKALGNFFDRVTAPNIAQASTTSNSAYTHSAGTRAVGSGNADTLAGRKLQAAQSSKRLALVIGNDGYRKVTPLENARNDARLMTATLKKAGFDVTQLADLGRDAMWGAIDTFKNRIQKGDEVVFYYAGHGVQINSNQLLLPIDIAAVNDSQVQRDGVSLVEVQDALKDARFALLVVDACRDNPFPKTGTRSIGEGTRGLIPPEPVTGQIIMMSAGRNQRALDSVPGESQGNGLFTWELTQVMQTPGVEIREALERVKNRVDDRAKAVGHEQRPGMVSDLRGNFYFFGPTTVQIQQGGNASADPETQTWTTAERVNSISGYQAYLDAYPGGRYAVAAKIALDSLKQPAQPAARVEDPETAMWNEVKQSGAREYLDAYLKQYPKGKFVTLARIEIKKLDDQAVQKAQTEQNDWERAKAADTEVANANGMLAGRYKDNNNGTVTDSVTNLQWVRCSLGQSWSGNTCDGKANSGGFDLMQKQVPMSFAGYSDWRVPTIEELKTLIYCSGGQPSMWNTTGLGCGKTSQSPAIAAVTFPKTPGQFYWSTSSYTVFSSDKWLVNFETGAADGYSMNSDASVRVVRIQK